MSIRKYFLILLLLFGFGFYSPPIHASEKFEKAMDTQSPDELNRLDEKGASLPGNEGKKQIRLTDKELSWLVEHPVIRLGFHKGLEPAVIIEKDGKLSGFLVDFFDMLNRKLRTNIVIETGAWPDIIQRARNQEIDGIAAIAPVGAKANGLLSTRSHFINYITVFVQADDQNEIKSYKDLEGRTVSHLKGYKLAEILLEPFQDKIKVIETRSPLEAIKLVIEGKADAVVGLNIDNYLITRHMLHGIKTGFMDIDHPIEAVTAIRNDWPELVGILNKGIDSIGQAKINEITAKWLDVRTPTQTIQLTEKEKAWLADHPEIRVGIMDAWPPMNYVDANGTPRGIGVDYLNAINKRLGGVLNVVPAPFKDNLDAVKSKKLDALMDITPKPDREPFFNFTKPYLKIPQIIVGRKNAPYFDGEKGLYGKKVGLERGYYTIKRFKRDHPEIKIREYANTSDSLDAVSRGEVDAYVGNRAVAIYLIEKELIANIQIMGRTSEPPVPLAIGIRKDWPELAEILDKVLASLLPQEVQEIHQKWVSVRASPTASSDVRDSVLPILGLIVGILIVFTAVIWLLIRLIGDRLPSALQAAGSRMAGLIIVSVFVAAIVAYAWFGIRSMERQVRAERLESLSTVLLTTQEALRLLMEIEKDHIDEYARDPRLIEIVRRHLEVTRTRNALLTSSSLKDLRAYFSSDKEFHDKKIGFFIISKDLINIASARDKNIGWHNLIAEQRPELLQRVFAGETVFVPPIHSDVPLLEEGSGKMQVAPPTMFIAAPVREEGGNVIAVVTLRFNPADNFTRLCQSGRVGRSGETYAFDQNALLLSQSRFEDNLVQAGLLPKGKRSTLSVRISDPGGNLLEGFQPSTPPDKQPLTYMAASAVSGLAGTNVEGYRDYRGVRVLGAWLWDERLNIGLATEIDEQEVLATQLVQRRIVLSILGLTVLLMSLLSGFVIWSGGQVNRSLKKARDDWERLAKERMDNLRESENRFRSYFVSVPVGVAVTAPNTGWLDVNEHLCKMLGYTRDELIKTTWSQIRVADELELDREKFQRMLAGEIENYSLDARFVGKSGNTVYTDLGVACTRNEDGSVSKILLSMIDITERKKVEEVIKESEQQHKAIFENSPLGMIQFNAEGKVVRFNINMLELLGTTSEQLDGFDAGKDIGNEDLKQALLTALHGEAATFENWYTSVTGTQTRYLRVIFNPIDEGAKSTEVIAAAEDITERKKMEENVQRNMKELEQFSSMSVGREKQMIKLKEEINELLSKQGQEKKYSIVE